MNVQQFALCTGISPHTVRYYDKLGLLPGIGRNASGHRIFCPQDITWMGFILRLKSTGMPLQDIQAYAVLRAAGGQHLRATPANVATPRNATATTSAGAATLPDPAARQNSLVSK